MASHVSRNVTTLSASGTRLGGEEEQVEHRAEPAERVAALVGGRVADAVEGRGRRRPCSTRIRKRAPRASSRKSSPPATETMSGTPSAQTDPVASTCRPSSEARPRAHHGAGRDRTRTTRPAAREQRQRPRRRRRPCTTNRDGGARAGKEGRAGPTRGEAGASAVRMPAQDRGRLGRASVHERVHRHELIHAARHRVAALEDAAGPRAVTHRHHQLGRGGGLVGLAERHLHVAGDGPGDEEQVGVAR